MKDNVKKNKKNRNLNLKVDFAFKNVFGNKSHINSLKYLLYTILGYSDDRFEEINILNTEQIKDYDDGKETRLDILVKLKNGEYINIEMQMDNITSNEKRFLYYWSIVYNRQLKAGERYDKLAKTISINLLDYELKNSEKMHSVYHITEDESGRIFTDMLEIHTIELPKLNKTNTLKEENQDFIRLMKFISSESEEERKMLARQKAELKEIINLMDTMTDDDEQWFAYLSRQKFLRDQITKEYYWQTKIKEAKKALEKSEKQLKESEKLLQEKERKLIESEKRGMVKALLMQNMSDEEIMEMVDISKNDLKKLKKEIIK